MPEIPQAAPRAAGRPARIDPETVAAIALELFDQHGYAEVSMAQIADAAGIGRKSLYRYFASKADLVWGGLSEAALISEQAMHTALRSPDALLDALHSATLAALQSLPDLEVTRGRLRIISQQPELIAQAPLRLSGQHQKIVRFLGDGGLGQEEAHYLAIAYGSLSFAAWIRWAGTNDPTPNEHLQQAVSVLRLSATH